jgi:hypothetical protein
MKISTEGNENLNVINDLKKERKLKIIKND